MKIIDIGTDPTTTLTSADLDNPSHPGSKYLGIEIFGTAISAVRRIILPKPATEDDCYELVVAVPPGLLFGDSIEIADDPVLGSVVVITPLPNTAQELTWFVATDQVARAESGGTVSFDPVRSLRLRVLARPNGCEADNGYAGVPVPP